ncbi:hypothetical protein B0H16DRAFT_1859199 [Mycena metata]|uniref:Uncharacterized protein n=1 Tax=Mycena metata TaxID=1033252 RepID=A0AAD7NV49_9AGAR|nr:hypothetical protein B0H16DRAFT_1859199 [Mycena metata]
MGTPDEELKRRAMCSGSRLGHRYPSAVELKDRLTVNGQLLDHNAIAAGLHSALNMWYNQIPHHCTGAPGFRRGVAWRGVPQWQCWRVPKWHVMADKVASSAPKLRRDVEFLMCGDSISRPENMSRNPGSFPADCEKPRAEIYRSTTDYILRGSRAYMRLRYGITWHGTIKKIRYSRSGHLGYVGFRQWKYVPSKRAQTSDPTVEKLTGRRARRYRLHTPCSNVRGRLNWADLSQKFNIASKFRKADFGGQSRKYVPEWQKPERKHEQEPKVTAENKCSGVGARTKLEAGGTFSELKTVGTEKGNDLKVPGTCAELAGGAGAQAQVGRCTGISGPLHCRVEDLKLTGKKASERPSKILDRNRDFLEWRLTHWFFDRGFGTYMLGPADTDVFVRDTMLTTRQLVELETLKNVMQDSSSSARPLKNAHRPLHTDTAGEYLLRVNEQGMEEVRGNICNRLCEGSLVDSLNGGREAFSAAWECLEGMRASLMMVQSLGHADTATAVTARHGVTQLFPGAPTSVIVAAALVCLYYYTQITVHRRSLSTNANRDPGEQPARERALKICTEAARACIRVADAHRRRKSAPPLIFSQVGAPTPFVGHDPTVGPAEVQTCIDAQVSRENMAIHPLLNVCMPLTPNVVIVLITILSEVLERLLTLDHSTTEGLNTQMAGADLGHFLVPGIDELNLENPLTRSWLGLGGEAGGPPLPPVFMGDGHRVFAVAWRAAVAVLACPDVAR